MAKDKKRLQRTPEQEARAAKRATERQAERDLATTTARNRAEAQQLAQIINLQIAGMTLEQIGAEINMSATDLDALIVKNASRYIKTQSQLRAYARNWISEKYSKMIEADWDDAVSTDPELRLPNQDRVIRMLDSMRKMHGADAPAQTEVKVDAAPEAIDAMVQLLAAKQGQGYDVDIFDVDVVDESEIHEASAQVTAALMQAEHDIDSAATDGVSGNEEI